MSGECDSDDREEEPGEVYPVGPADPERVDREPAVYPVARPEPREPEQPPFQFTLAEMLLLMAVLSLVLGVLAWVSRVSGPGAFAGIAGFGLLVSLLVLALLGPTQPIVRLGWVAMLVIYGLACLMAIIKG